MHFPGPSRSDRKRTARPDRLEYLDRLVVEFQETKSKEAKQQLLANLANFAYDPFNYNFFRQLNILDLFLDQLEDSNEVLVKFAAGGLCNLCLDPVNKEYIWKNDGVKKIANLLRHSNHEINISAITTLMYLTTPNAKPDTTDKEIIKQILCLNNSNNARVRNLCEIFLKDYCSQEQVSEAGTGRSAASEEVAEIPLPES